MYKFCLMNNIYSYINEDDIKHEISDISYKLEEEMSKPINERDRKKEFNLIYQQFIKGLKLSIK